MTAKVTSLPKDQGFVMRISYRVFLRSTLLLSLVAGPFMPALSASSITYAYSGKIQEVSAAATAATGVVVGDKISGSFTYDSSQTGSGGIYSFTGVSLAHTFNLNVFNSSGALQFPDSFAGGSSYFSVNVSYRAASSGGTYVEVQGDTKYKQSLGVSGPGPPPAYYLVLFNPTNAGGYSATNLPLPNSNLINDFVKTTGVLNWDPHGQSFSADITQFTAIPEPSSLILSIVAIATCAAGRLITRRKAWRSSRYAAMPHH